VIVTVETSVDVDLADIDTEDLVAELDKRFDSPYCERPDVDAMYNALRDGNTALVLKLAREYVELHSSRIVV
jgi:hypothetical protein